jgi:cytosine deaminase
MGELLSRGGRPWGHAAGADILVRAGVIDRIESGIQAPDAEVIDVSGRLVLPGLVEAHCHLDKTLYGGGGVQAAARPGVQARTPGSPRVGRIEP